MAIRNDISFDWESSPRKVTVDAPSIELTMQDLLDTLRYNEALSQNMDNQSIVAGNGKVVLDTSGNATGLTIQLINATVGFETRTGPEWVECALNGGNLSGLETDTVTVTTQVTHNNPFVNINKTSSVSATQANSDSLEFSTFNGGVMIDQTNSSGRAQAGTLFPAGTEQQPCLNLTDLNAISISRGLNKIYVKGDLLLDDSGSWVGHEFVGDSALKTVITIPSDADVFNCEFYDCTVTGTLDGSSQIEKAVITDLDFVEGFIFNCAIGPATIKLGVSTTANIFSCFSTVPGSNTPIIDMNGTGTLALRDYNGGILLTNYTGTGSHSVDLAAGQVRLDPTITGGTFIIRGVGKLIDTSGDLIPSGTWNGGVTIVNELLTAANIPTAVENALELLDNQTAP